MRPASSAVPALNCARKVSIGVRSIFATVRAVAYELALNLFALLAHEAARVILVRGAEGRADIAPLAVVLM
jgi:hypothetical protein